MNEFRAAGRTAKPSSKQISLPLHQTPLAPQRPWPSSPRARDSAGVHQDPAFTRSNRRILLPEQLSHSIWGFMFIICGDSPFTFSIFL